MHLEFYLKKTLIQALKIGYPNLNLENYQVQCHAKKFWYLSNYLAVSVILYLQSNSV